MRDIENACASVREMCDTSFLTNASMLITGGTGLIGGMLARSLLRLSESIKLQLPVRSVDRLPEELRNDARVSAFEADLTEALSVDGPIDYIVHAASPTASKDLREHSDECTAFMAKSMVSLLTLAKQKRIKKFMYISSMEVYTGCRGSVTEDMRGDFDLGNPRSCYPVGKLTGESVSTEYAKNNGFSSVSVRLAQTFGEGIGKNENRVFAQFARSALAGEDIVLRTEGKSIGNYLHISDCMSALVLLLEKGEGIYNISGDNCHMPVRELAELIASLLSGGRSRLTFDLAPAGSYPPDSAYILDSSKLKALGWAPKYSVSDMILSLGRDLKGE